MPMRQKTPVLTGRLFLCIAREKECTAAGLASMVGSANLSDGFLQGKGPGPYGIALFQAYRFSAHCMGIQLVRAWLAERKRDEIGLPKGFPHANNSAWEWMASAVRWDAQAGRDSVHRRCSRANLCQMRVYQGAKGQEHPHSLSALPCGNKQRPLVLYGYQQSSQNEKDGKRKKKALKSSAGFFYNGREE